MISSLALRLLVRELGGLEGARLQKATQLGDNLFRLAFAGKRDLLVEPGVRANLTAYKLEGPQKASQSTMVLRKHLQGKVLRSVRQLGFDRIIVLDFGERALVVELFADGNLIITDSGGRIEWVLHRGEWSSRSLKRGEAYKPPDSRPDPTKFSEREFAEEMKEKTIASSLSKHLLAGQSVVNELCLRARVSPGEAAPSKEATRDLFRAWQELLSAPPNPVVQSGEPLPFTFLSLPKPTVFFETISEAIDEAHKQSLEANPAENKRLLQLERRLAQQQAAISKIVWESEAAKRIGDAIYANWEKVSEILDVARKGDEKKLSLLGAVKKGLRVTAEL